MPTLNWIGKDKVVTHHNDVPFRVLDKQYTFGDTPDSGNMIIHGDNLEALKALLPKYEGKIKCIYIDPPYNTGNEGWVYNDNVNDPHIKKWLGQVVGSEVDDLTRHDKWLCMMYPRLVLLQRLLSEDGAIFISIDDNELYYLKCICDEIFGTSNFIGNIIRATGTTTGQDSTGLGKSFDYITCYAKSKFFDVGGIQLSGGDKERYNLRDEKGYFSILQLRRTGGEDKREDRPTMYFPIIAPDGTEVYPIGPTGYESRWRVGQETVAERMKNNELYFKKDSKGRWKVYYKYYLENKTKRPSNLWVDIDGNKKAQIELKNVFGYSPFDTPKPTQLIERVLQIATDKDSIVLDCFAGSGTSAQAVLNLNRQDGGNRKFILCEMCDYAETITAERVRRVMSGYGEGKNAVEGTGGSFDYYELGETIFDPVSGNLNDNADTEQIKRYVWFSETNAAYVQPEEGAHPYLLGSYQGNNYYFYYIKGEETCLDWDFLNTFTQRDRAEMYIIYADRCVLTPEELLKHNIVFKKIPRDIKRV